MARETKAVRVAKREMRNFVMNYAEGRYPEWKLVDRAMTRIFGFTQGIIAINEKSYDEIADLWERFRANIYVWEGIYKASAWSSIDGVFEQRL